MVSVLDSLESWMAADLRERLAAVELVIARIPKAFHYRELATHDYCGLRRTVARFDHRGRTFALLPGVRNLTLGYAPELLTFDSIALAVIAEEAEKLFDTTPEEHLARFRQQLLGETSPRRSVSLAPFLIAEEAETRESSSTSTEVGTQLAEEGFRLPSEDEWEYACGAGRDSFFKWGDRMPCEASPPGNDPPDGDVVFGDAVRPNAFGLRIADDPYHWEFCRTPGVFRGGDGGESWCGGSGLLDIYRALGTPYRCVVAPREIMNPFTRKRETMGIARSAAVRPVFPLVR